MERFCKRWRISENKMSERISGTLDNSIQIDMTAMAKVIDAYRSFGYEVRIGNPDCLATCLYHRGRFVHASFAISLSDCLVFQLIASLGPWRRALVIGNAFGFSTFVIAGLCSGSQVDAIDAEIEGSQNRLGSELTRQIANSFFPGVRLTVGFSPGDLPKACRFDRYDLIFIDGHHTNAQLIADFKKIRERRAEECVVYFHDVGMAKMQKGWDYVTGNLLREDDKAFELHFTSFGSTMVIKGNRELALFMEEVCRPLFECVYSFGARHIGFRSALKMLNRTMGYGNLTEMLKSRFKLDSHREKILPLLQK